MENIIDTIINSKDWLLVKYYKPGCAKCDLIEPLIVQDLLYIPECKYIKVDASKLDDATKTKIGIQYLPYICLYHDGKEIANVWGFKPRLLKELLNIPKEHVNEK